MDCCRLMYNSLEDWRLLCDVPPSKQEVSGLSPLLVPVLAAMYREREVHLFCTHFKTNDLDEHASRSALCGL